MFRRVRVARLLFLVAVLTGWAFPAAAHGPMGAPDAPGVAAVPGVAWQAAQAPAAIPWPALLVALAVLAARVRRPRRAVALGLVLILALFVFETGVHSVHHLGDRPGNPACVVASAMAQLAGTPVDLQTIEPVIRRAPEMVALEQQTNPAVRSLAVHRGRAPPLAA